MSSPASAAELIERWLAARAFVIAGSACVVAGGLALVRTPVGLALAWMRHG